MALFCGLKHIGKSCPARKLKRRIGAGLVPGDAAGAFCGICAFGPVRLRVVFGCGFQYETPCATGRRGKARWLEARAGVAELVDALGLGPNDASRGGSNPSARTSFSIERSKNATFRRLLQPKGCTLADLLLRI
jgi:hypothetical protein